ncbi:DUF2846 domain-containing protein [Variovorax sp. OV329]|uniref:DUF2846 domain-containing protein n=1 Tax=Variovorax sp. OV329 TaxID=1882825 RepID=UPI0008E3826D|nr:DUF2846 domain-containing protein [Variovorax sp. OV329]SFM98773.1 Protein of unknown function [Variovorax sp. OV329]
MMRWLSWMGMAAAALCLVGCGATGPRYMEIEGKLPPLEKEQGRVFFYRASALGAAVQPEVRLNGQLVGTSQPNSFFFVDRPAGEYRASAKTETEATLNVKVQPMAVSYVAMGIGFGLLVGRPTFSMVSEAQARAELPSLAYGGSLAVSTQTAAASPAGQGPAIAQGVAPAAPTPAVLPASAAPAATAPAARATAPAAPANTPFGKTSMQDLQQLMPAAR